LLGGSLGESLEFARKGQGELLGEGQFLKPGAIECVPVLPGLVLYASTDAATTLDMATEVKLVVS
jgi:hypothetical protein